MIQIPDHPDIRSAERTGYAPWHTPEELCPRCGGQRSEWMFEIDGEYVCLECFQEWVHDILTTNPNDVAAALDTPQKYTG